MNKERILVVDDEAFILDLCQKTLAGNGFDVLTASSGEKALDTLRSGPVDILLTDIRMPGMSGKELLKEAKELHPDLSAAIITGHGSLALAMESMKLGAQDFILKPFTTEELESTVNNLLERNRLLKENLRFKTLIPLLDTSRKLLEKVEMQDLCEFIASESFQAVACDITAVLLLEGNKIRLAAHQGIPPKLSGEIRVDNFFVKLDEKEMAIAEAGKKLAMETGCLVPGDKEVTSMVVPLCQNDLKSALFVGRHKGSKAFSDSDLESIKILANHAATAMERSKLYQKLSQALDDVRAADRVKTSFLQNMSHEFRTPLTVIIGFSEILLENRDEQPVLPDNTEELKYIRDEGQELLAIFESVMDATMLETGEVEVKREKINFSSLLLETMTPFEEMGKDKWLPFKTILPREEISIMSDQKLLQKVFSYILDNAVKFTEKGEVVVSLLKKGKDIIFKVRDSGVGIDSKKMGVIFDKFRQADESTTRRFGGVGLGLYNARKIMDLLGGRIDVVSPVLYNNSGKSGKGTEFIVTLPRRK